MKIKEEVKTEIWISRYYMRKAQRAAEDGYEFSLNLVSVRNLLLAKRCYYTGIELTKPELNEAGFVKDGYKRRLTDVTIDRIDSTKGYVKGNVVACAKGTNSFKSYFEGSNSIFNMEHLHRMSRKIKSTL